MLNLLEFISKINITLVKINMWVVHIKTDNQEKINYILILILWFSLNFLIMSGLSLFNNICENFGINNIIIFIVYIILFYPLISFMIKGYNLILKLANVKFSNYNKQEDKMRIPTLIGLLVVLNIIESTLQINNISSTYIRLCATSLLAVLFLLAYIKYYDKNEQFKK